MKGAEYRAAIVRARRRQLRLTKANVNRLMGVYNRAADDIVSRLERIPRDVQDSELARERDYMRLVLEDIEKALLQLRDLYTRVLRGSTLELAQAAVDREARLLVMSGEDLPARDPLIERSMSETVPLIDGGEIEVRFGRVAHDAVEALATRYFVDGLRLSERIWGIDNAMRRGIEDTLMQAVAEGKSVRGAIDMLKAGPLAATSNAARRAATLARTELAAAYTEAHIRSTKDPNTGDWRRGIRGVKWHLSTSHPKPDICDIWASHDEGLGQGVYRATELPHDHPNGLCFTTTVLEAVPESAGWSAGQAPRPAEVSPEEVQRYADSGERVAQAAAREQR